MRVLSNSVVFVLVDKKLVCVKKKKILRIFNWNSGNKQKWEFRFGNYEGKEVIFAKMTENLFIGFSITERAVKE